MKIEEGEPAETLCRLLVDALDAAALKAGEAREGEEGMDG